MKRLFIDVCGCLSAKTLLLACVLFLSGCGSAGMEYCIESGECELSVDVAKITGEIPIDPTDSFWKDASRIHPQVVELGPQMMTNPKWPDPSIKSVKITGVRNGSEIGLLLEWSDPSMENEIEVSATHTDQAALMFPLHAEKELPVITMGSEDEIVNIWQWRAIWEPALSTQSGSRGNNRRASVPAKERRSPVEDLTAAGFSTLTTQDEQDVMGFGVWQDKIWRVVFKRSLVNSDTADVQLKSSTAMAIAVWNGANRERNGQKGISNWILLRFK
ncbi:MAG: ethylbenzene dehydrogenase-related protein [Nitrospinaceae bacterium]|jgi:DMSO reductase family type II enzyme heme b subunit|nr:ethylbenzene dehydrogenase-related protein [Nitrospinaceae bacterium]